MVITYRTGKGHEGEIVSASQSLPVDVVRASLDMLDDTSDLACIEIDDTALSDVDLRTLLLQVHMGGAEVFQVMDISGDKALVEV